MTQSSRRRFSLKAMGSDHVKVAAIATLSLIGIPAFTLTAHAVLQDNPKEVLDQAWQIVNHNYVDPEFNQTNWREVRHQLLNRSYSSREEAYEALREALKLLEDPYTRFMSPEEFQAFNRSNRGELTGVGLQLRLDEETQALTVVRPIGNSPAAAAGIQPGDRILQIDAQSTAEMTVEAAAGLIRGEPNTQVRLLLQRQDGAPFEVTLTRARIELPAVTSSVRVEDNHRVGYIRLNKFDANSAAQMRQAIADLQEQQVDEFVLDLRDNPGGRLDQGIAIARMWLDQGDIVRTVDRRGQARQTRANRTALTNLPLAVLVNGNSASASEILTGALKDNQRAVIVGSQTFGKALVQSVNPLSDGSGLNVTIARYFTPSGVDINRRGITPDVVVELTEEQQKQLAANPMAIGTEQDPQYQQAIAQLHQTTFSVRP